MKNNLLKNYLKEELELLLKETVVSDKPFETVSFDGKSKMVIVHPESGKTIQGKVSNHRVENITIELPVGQTENRTPGEEITFNLSTNVLTYPKNGNGYNEPGVLAMWNLVVKPSTNQFVMKNYKTPNKDSIKKITKKEVEFSVAGAKKFLQELKKNNPESFSDINV